MKTKYTFIIALALVVSQLIGCKSTQTYSNTNSIKPINITGMGNKNTCSLSKSTKAERKYLAGYYYREGLEKSYAQNNHVDVANNAAGAGAAYMILTARK